MSDKKSGGNGNVTSLNDDGDISALYQSVSSEQPPQSVDTAILQMAKRTADSHLNSNDTSKPNSDIKEKSIKRKTWFFPSSIAASLMVVALFYFSLEQRQDVEPVADVRSSAPSSVSSATAEFASAESSVEISADYRDSEETQTLQEPVLAAQELAAQRIERADEANAYNSADLGADNRVKKMSREAPTSVQDVMPAPASIDTLKSSQVQLERTPNQLREALLDIQKQSGKSHQALMAAIEMHKSSATGQEAEENISYLSAEPTKSEYVTNYQKLQKQLHVALLIQKQNTNNFELLEKYRLLLTEEQRKSYLQNH